MEVLIIMCMHLFLSNIINRTSNAVNELKNHVEKIKYNFSKRRPKINASKLDTKVKWLIKTKKE